MESKVFGQLPDGRHVQQYTLRNAKGISVSVINYGCTITQLRTPDRNGRFDDIVLGFDTLDQYLGDQPYFGALIGRVAGRITRGTFELEKVRYQLDLNHAPNHLHGGRQGLDKRLWKATAKGESLILEYFSPDGEEGYPGNLNLQVSYTLDSNDTLRIEYFATTDKTTPLNLTNHSYFNLNGEGSGDMLDHELEIFTDQCVHMDDSSTTIHRRMPVEEGSNDFRQPARIGTRVETMRQNFGYLYLLDNDKREIRLASRIRSPRSGRVLEAYTDDTCMQLYTAPHLKGDLRGKSGTNYEAYAALCLECHGYPDAPNAPGFPSIYIDPENPYRQSTLYRFSCDSK